MRKIVPLAIAGGVLVASGGTYGAIEASAKEVDLSVDGAPSQVRTYQGTVSELLRANEIEVGAHDVVAPSLGTKLSPDQEISVRFGRPIDLTLDGRESELWTTALTVDEVTNELNVREESEISVSRSTPIGREGLELSITSAKEVRVKIGNEPVEQLVTTEPTVADVLSAKGIQLDGDDKVDPGKDEPVTEGMTITVDVHDEKKSTKDITIPHETQRKKSDKLEKGEVDVEQEGRDGKKVEHWVEKFVNGKSVSKEKVRTETVTEPEDRIVVEGTKEPEPEPSTSDEEESDSGSGSGSSGGSDSSDSDDEGSGSGSGSDSDSGDDSGSGKDGTGQIERCEASNYWQGQMTASGEQFDPNAMTAAHKTLKLGTWVRVTNTANGKSVDVRINDRGPYIGGRCIDLSRGSFSKIANPSAGVAQVKVEVIK